MHVCLLHRAGADRVTAVESVRHLAETAQAAVALNGCANRIGVVHKDARYLSVEGQGSSNDRPMHHDMPRPADLLAFEVS
jgi:tRNA1(Val) A37 N6-methylase TrmN6